MARKKIKSFHNKKYQVSFNQAYTVKELPAVVHPEDGRVAAMVSLDGKVIYLDSTRSYEDRILDLKHELGHAYSHEHNWCQLGISQEVEHLFVDALMQFLEHFFPTKPL